MLGAASASAGHGRDAARSAASRWWPPISRSDSRRHARRDRHGRARTRRSRRSARTHNLVISAWPAPRHGALGLSRRGPAGRAEGGRAPGPGGARRRARSRRGVRAAAARRACPPSSRTCRAWPTSSRSTRTSGRPASTRASSTAIPCGACCRRSSIRTRSSTARCSAASWGARVTTWATQNHPMIRALYAQHGRTLWFAGVVVTVAQATEPERVRSAVPRRRARRARARRRRRRASPRSAAARRTWTWRRRPRSARRSA